MSITSSNTAPLEDWIESLTDAERAIFDKGYLAALKGVLEQISESKIKLYNRVLEADEEDNSEVKRQLLSRIKVLDVYEKHYNRRVKVLEPSLPAEYA